MAKIKESKLVPLPKLLAKAQTVFNKYIRERDKNLGCISCGKPVEHAGHYFNVGHYSALRYNTMNVNGQCVRCNTYAHGNLINYRKGLVIRYGEERVKQLELLPEINKVKKWSRVELNTIIEIYKNKISK
jgi:hypothetical protein